MKKISSRTHGILDYVVGAVLILSPILFDFRIGGVAQWLPVFLGVFTILYSLCTNYELGVVKVLSFRAHLGIDAASGALLAISPWIFGFADFVWVPHLVFGLLELGAVMMTRSDVGIHHAPPPAVR